MIMKISSRIASAAVIIDGVTPISMLMFASRIACQTISAIASRPGDDADTVPHVAPNADRPA